MEGAVQEEWPLGAGVQEQILGEHFLHPRNAGNWVQAGVRYKNLQPELNKAIIDFIHKRKAEKRVAQVMP